MTRIDDSNIRIFVNAYINNRSGLPIDLQNSPIGDWDVSRVQNMEELFSETDFNEDINNWDVSNVVTMNGMFNGATIFNQPLDNWDVSNVQDMNNMFSRAIMFNQPLNDWDESNVQDMSSMFHGATTFNQPLNGWNVSNVNGTPGMFQDAISFNQPLENWDVSEIYDMTRMFNGAINFNQQLNGWNVRNVYLMGDMFVDSPTEIPNWYGEDEELFEGEDEELFEGEEEDEEELANRRAQQLATQREAVERARIAATQAPVITPQDYPECVICGNYLNNVDGPDPTDKCRANCEDVVNVCRNNHLFHRACILNSCNADAIDIVGQMNIQGRGVHNVQQSIATICPICRAPLVPSCEGMRIKTRVATANIGMDGMEINLTGGRRRKTRKHKRGRKHKKTNKHKKHKKTTKHKKHKTHRRGGKKNNRKTRKH